MLEELNPAEFEAWCKVLFERVYKCPVEDLPLVGDMGRDLIIHHPTGKMIVECKHQPQGSVGRPIIQKLHSAVMTEAARKGIVITTGRFSPGAIQYSGGLDVEIELIDGAKLSYMAAQAGLAVGASPVDDKTALGVKTSSETEFSRAFPEHILVEPRYNPGPRSSPAAIVRRSTRYEGAFLAEFTATGEIQTADGPKAASWQGHVWASLDGARFGTGPPPGLIAGQIVMVPLAAALEAAPGPTTAPRLQPHEATGQMKNFLLESLAKTVRYTGRNNQTYTRQIRPATRATNVTNVRLVYVPQQTFELQIGEAKHTGEVRENGGRFQVLSRSMSACCICRRAVDERSQVFCSVCHRTAHARRFLTPDSFRCGRCRATLCSEHARKVGRETVCERCVPNAPANPRKRWLPHLILAVALSTVVAAILLATTAANFEEVALFAIATLGLGWFPFFYVTTKGSGTGSGKWLQY